MLCEPKFLYNYYIVFFGPAKKLRTKEKIALLKRSTATKHREKVLDESVYLNYRICCFWQNSQTDVNSLLPGKILLAY